MIRVLFFCILALFTRVASTTTFGLDCDASDNNLIHLKDVICQSLGCATTTNVTASCDWPNQAMYYIDLLRALTHKDTCLDTDVAKTTVDWLDVTDPAQNMWWWTWDVFQVEYYDMPRKPGERIESPATLGRKCWAFAYLAQVWPSLKPHLQEVVGGAGLNLQPMYDAYDYAVPLTMPLCDHVMANCFLNTTYLPEVHNGTCNDSIEQFYIGFQWENGDNDQQGRYDRVEYPFPNYHMSNKMKDDATFAVNTVLNFII